MFPIIDPSLISDTKEIHFLVGKVAQKLDSIEPNPDKWVNMLKQVEDALSEYKIGKNATFMNKIFKSMAHLKSKIVECAINISKEIESNPNGLYTYEKSVSDCNFEIFGLCNSYGVERENRKSY